MPESQSEAYWSGYFDATASDPPLFDLIMATEGDDWLTQDIALLKSLGD